MVARIDWLGLGAGRLRPLAAGGVLSVALVAGLPHPTLARSEPPQVEDPWPRTPPVRQVLTGGVVRLKAPGSTMIRIPASTSLLGSTELEVLEATSHCPPLHIDLEGELPLNACHEQWFSQELPRRPVTLAAFWLDRTEVTVGAYQRCVELRRCRPVPFSEGASRFGHPQLPVTLVTLDDARSYCAFRRARLPTEAEWERAARGFRGSIYPWGRHFHRKVANHGRIGWDTTESRDGYAELAPVGSFPSGRTPSGLLDMAGNVAEWVSDLYAPYSAGPQINPTGPSVLTGGGSLRVIRGGSYQSPPPQLRGAARQVAEASTRATTIGFRCARSATRPVRSESTSP